MADFLTAYKRSSIYEGGYANDPADHGGETWKGVARKMHPAWSGWVIVDTYKSHSDFPRVLRSDQNLEWAVQKFYHDCFWLPMWGDRIMSQVIANDIYDDEVNTGQSGIKKAQRVAGLEESGKMSEELLRKINNQ
jgi:lysozyme family protein